VDTQNGDPTRPQPKSKPEAQPLGYVEDFDEARTKLGAVFGIHLFARAGYRDILRNRHPNQVDRDEKAVNDAEKIKGDLIKICQDKR
jgi:hypothetical protein